MLVNPLVVVLQSSGDHQWLPVNWLSTLCMGTWSSLRRRWRRWRGTRGRGTAFRVSTGGSRCWDNTCLCCRARWARYVYLLLSLTLPNLTLSKVSLLRKAVEDIQHLQQLINYSSSLHCSLASPQSSSYTPTPFMDSSFYPESASSPLCLTPNSVQTSPASKGFLPSFSPITPGQSETWTFEDLGCHPLKRDLKIGHTEDHPMSLPGDYELIEAIAEWQRHWRGLKRTILWHLVANQEYLPCSVLVIIIFIRHCSCLVHVWLTR